MKPAEEKREKRVVVVVRAGSSSSRREQEARRRARGDEDEEKEEDGEECAFVRARAATWVRVSGVRSASEAAQTAAAVGVTEWSAAAASAQE